jgi:hypothetical protein
MRQVRPSLSVSLCCPLPLGRLSPPLPRAQRGGQTFAARDMIVLTTAPQLGRARLCLRPGMASVSGYSKPELNPARTASEGLSHLKLLRLGGVADPNPLVRDGRPMGLNQWASAK